MTGNTLVRALIKQHAAVLALTDAFLLASYLCVGLAVLMWFAYSTRLPIVRPLKTGVNECTEEP